MSNTIETDKWSWSCYHDFEDTPQADGFFIDQFGSGGLDIYTLRDAEADGSSYPGVKETWEIGKVYIGSPEEFGVEALVVPVEYLNKDTITEAIRRYILK